MISDMEALLKRLPEVFESGPSREDSVRKYAQQQYFDRWAGGHLLYVIAYCRLPCPSIIAAIDEKTHVHVVSMSTSWSLIGSVNS